tara:strand:+ start:34 stop:879 length:846 start_codon:yes stop_codon:yes gene_type:complete
MINRKKIGITFAAAFSAASLLLIGSHLRNSQLFMPSEYKLIKNIVNKLAKNNDLGDREIGFHITAGDIASYYAKELGLCKKDDKKSCYYHSYLNPFKKHPNPEINEIINLSYLSGSGYAWASALGAVRISHNFFRIIEEKENQMACIVAHELAHIINLDTFNNSVRLNEEAQGFKEEKRKELSAQFSRQSELDADKYAQEMIIKAGYPKGSCIEALDRLMKTRPLPKVTKLDEHPPTPIRLSALKEALPIQLDKIEKSVPEVTPIKWKYDRDLNYLKFTPL